MRSRTLADERTRDFYAKLKRPYLFSWYMNRLGSESEKWCRLTSDQKQSEFKINQIAFFKKHFWYHFNKSSINGWIPVKHFRKNYCRLKLPAKRFPLNVNSELACIITVCRYIRPNVDVSNIITQYRKLRSVTVNERFMMIVSRFGRFQNISHKSMRRIRNQIRHQRPVVMMIRLMSRISYVIVDGFNRRLFQYVLPRKGCVRLITRERLLKEWRKCRYWAVSC